MNKIHEVVQKLRSGSDSDRSSLVSSLSEEESSSCQKSRSSAGYELSGSGRDAVWVTDASTPASTRGYFGGGPQVASFRSDHSLPNTPITLSGTGTGSDGDSLDLSSSSSSLSTSRDKSPSTISAHAMQKSVYKSLADSTDSGHAPLERKSSKPRQQPKGTFEYKVQDGDTLNKIGARYDVTPSELMKINKLLSRTLFPNQTLFVPDPDYVNPDPAPVVTPTSPKQPQTSPSGSSNGNGSTSGGPAPVDTRPKVDVPLANLGDRSPPAVPGHVVQVATSPVFKPNQPARQHSKNEDDDPNRECLQKFVKIRSRRILEDEKMEFGEVTCRGTLLVTPNAMMFDPDVNDPHVLEAGDQAKYSIVVYMENVKSVALYPDLSPRLFWKQSKEIRSKSPRPEPYKPNPMDETDAKGVSLHCTSEGRQAPDGISTPDVSSLKRHSPEGGNELQGPTDSAKEKNDPTASPRRMSDELEDLNDELSRKLPVSPSQPGRTSEEVEHMLTSTGDLSESSHLQHQMSRSSELAVSEIALFDEVSKEIGATRDFGPHMGRSSSEMCRQGLSGSQNRVFISSPRESTNSGLSVDRSDSTTDNLNTPTQGFAPVFFTDRSPNSAIAAPKPVPGQKNVLRLSDLGSLSEDAQSIENRLSGEGQDQVYAPGARDSGIGSSSADDDSKQVRTDQSSSPKDSDKADFDRAASQQQEEDHISTNVSTEELPGRKDDHFGVCDVANAMQHNLDIASQETNGKQKLPSDATDGVMPASSIMDGLPSSISGALPSSFSPLRTPAQHISSFFNYTTGFFRASDKDTKNGEGGGGTPGSITSTPPAAEVSALNKISKNLPSFQFPSSFIPSAFSNSLQSPSSSTPSISTSAAQGTAQTVVSPSGALLSPDDEELKIRNSGGNMEVMSKMGEPLTTYLPRSDSPQFSTSPMYLQVRTGLPNNEDLLTPKSHAIDQEIADSLDEDFWFAIPRDMTNKLYKFLIDWQPDAYGDQEDCENRERYFYDAKELRKLAENPYDLDEFCIIESSWEVMGHRRQFAKQQLALRAKAATQALLDEVALPDLVNGPSTILNQEHLKKLMTAIPRNMSVGYNWALVFSTSRHGFSLQQLYREMRVMEDCPVILCLRDTDHNVFGAYLSNMIRLSEGFYGSGSTFLFTFYPEFKHYHWQGDNCYFMNGTRDCFAIGAGEGIFGLWLDSDLDKGSSHACPTFDNHLLTTNEDFHIVSMEVWQLTDSTS